MGHAELWERAATAGNGDRARSAAREVSGCQSGKRIQEFVMPITAARVTADLALSTWHLATVGRAGHERPQRFESWDKSHQFDIADFGH